MKYIAKSELFHAVRIPFLREGRNKVMKFYEEARLMGFPSKFETYVEELSTSKIHVKVFSIVYRQDITGESGDYIIKSRYNPRDFYFINGAHFEQFYQGVDEVVIRHATGNGLTIKATGDVEITGNL